MFLPQILIIVPILTATILTTRKLPSRQLLLLIIILVLMAVIVPMEIMGQVITTILVRRIAILMDVAMAE
jgi:hypothetical protein